MERELQQLRAESEHLRLENARLRAALEEAVALSLRLPASGAPEMTAGTSCGARIRRDGYREKSPERAMHGAKP